LTDDESVNDIGLWQSVPFVNYSVREKCLVLYAYCMHIGVTTWSFGETWRHRSREHSIPLRPFPNGTNASVF